MEMSVAQRRLANQRITDGHLRRAVDVVSWFGAVQAQEYEPAKWGIGLRMGENACDADIERAIERGEILRTHVMRPTWHFVAARDIRWLLELTAPRVHRTLAYYNRQVELDQKTLVRGRACHRTWRVWNGHPIPIGDDVLVVHRKEVYGTFACGCARCDNGCGPATRLPCCALPVHTPVHPGMQVRERMSGWQVPGGFRCQEAPSL